MEHLKEKDLFIYVLLMLLGNFIFGTAAYAEMKVFEKEVEEIASRDQSQEQVEAFALQKAKRLAVEEAGTYISSLTIVKDYRLERDEVMALASGVVQANLTEVPSVRVEKGVIHVKVKARVKVDTSILDRQIQEIMKEKDTLQKLETERTKVKDLEEKLANLKSSETKRLEELNAQALAIESERQKQKLAREKQVLEAKGELNKVQADRLQKEKEHIDKINKLLSEQENARKLETDALLKEKDRLKQVQIENENKWNELARRAKLKDFDWLRMDDTLSIKQAIEEAKQLKLEIFNLSKQLNIQYEKNKKNLQDTYEKQRELITPKLPPQPASKSDFETKAQYETRIEKYNTEVNRAPEDFKKRIEIMNAEEEQKIGEANIEHLEATIKILKPFVNRLKSLQEKRFSLPEEKIEVVELGSPDPENSRFPITFKYKYTKWDNFLYYGSPSHGEDIRNTTHLLKVVGNFAIGEETGWGFLLSKAGKVTSIFSGSEVWDGVENAKLFSKAANNDVVPVLVSFSVSHPAKANPQLIKLSEPNPKYFSEIDLMQQIESRGLPAAKKKRSTQARDGRFIAYDNGTVLDRKTNLMWAARDNGSNINWQGAKNYCENYRGGGYTDWRMPTQNELAGLYDASIGYTPVCAKGGDTEKVYLTNLITFSCWAGWASEAEGAHFDFHYGWPYWVHLSSDSRHRALPVRSGK